MGSDMMVGQQTKLVTGLEMEFQALRESQTKMVNDAAIKDSIITEYENFGQAVVPPIVKSRLQQYRIGIITTGGQNVPGGLMTTLSASSAQVLTQTVVLQEMALSDPVKRAQTATYFKLDPNIGAEELRGVIGARVAQMISRKASPEDVKFLQDNGLIKFSGDYNTGVDAVIIFGGTDTAEFNFSSSFDRGLLDQLLQENVIVIGAENSACQLSYMSVYQQYKITTIDNIDLSPGQVSAVFAIAGESGNYGIKKTAVRFMPTIPVDLSTNGVIVSNP